MATNKLLAPNIDNSDPSNYPDGRIRDNTGAGNGTPVNRLIYGDLHEFFAKLMRLAEIEYSGVPDNEANGYQLVDALVSIAGKNDFITSLNSVSGVIQVPLKLTTLKLNESLVCLSAFNYTSETQIKGSGALLKTVNVPSAFKAGDYIRLVVTNIGIDLIRIADSISLNAMAAELLFLKAATEAEEYAGAINTKATTPYHNQLAFARRVIGLDSGLFLASTTRNGLMSAADKVFLAGITNPVKNIGWFSGVNSGGETPGAMKPRSGDVVSAQVQYNNAVGESTFLVTLANSMTGTNYFLRIHIQSEGLLISDDNILHPVFKVVSNTQVEIAVEHSVPGITGSLKVHIEAVQIS